MIGLAGRRKIKPFLSLKNGSENKFSSSRQSSETKPNAKLVFVNREPLLYLEFKVYMVQFVFARIVSLYSKKRVSKLVSGGHVQKLPFFFQIFAPGAGQKTPEICVYTSSNKK